MHIGYLLAFGQWNFQNEGYYWACDSWLANNANTLPLPHHIPSRIICKVY